MEAGGTPAPETAETCGLSAARGRVLAMRMPARLDMPPADNSSMDGYAIRAADYQAGRVMPISQRCYAGDMPAPLAPATAARVFTGSVLPAGADTVVIQENSVESGDTVVLNGAVTPGQFVRWKAEDLQAGATMLEAGAVLGAAEIGLLAAQGIDRVPVFPRLRVGVLTTGDEIVAPGQPIGVHQIYNSNGFIMEALLRGMGVEVSLVTHARDDEASLRSALLELARRSDLILTAGGVSVGERDLVKPVLESLGGELALWKVRMKPGKPVALGRVEGTPVVCLPGNPVSVFAVFTVLVTPMLRRMQGRAVVLPPVGRLALSAERSYHDSREEFLRVQARITEDGGVVLVPHAGQSSGIMSALPWATGLARIPADQSRGDGDRVQYYDFRHWQV